MNFGTKLSKTRVRVSIARINGWRKEGKNSIGGSLSSPRGTWLYPHLRYHEKNVLRSAGVCFRVLENTVNFKRIHFLLGNRRRRNIFIHFEVKYVSSKEPKWHPKWTSSSVLLFTRLSVFKYCVLLLICGIVTTSLSCDSPAFTFKFLMCVQPEFQDSMIFLYTNTYLLNVFLKYLCGM